MDNPAPTEHDIHDLMTHRWSPRAFESRPVDKAALARCFEAARWAPSSYNEQPWSFAVASRDDEEGYKKILNCLIDFNQGWAKQADVLGIGITAKRFQKNDKPNAHDRHDLGMAMMSLALQAQAEGLAMHMMAGFDA
ncbi:MAG: nitroreductase family protein, partial [Phycisphaeraceae bacterium]|nr:nitroreductase family protein [Phycisphaeraceae bacterium]